MLDLIEKNEKECVSVYVCVSERERRVSKMSAGSLGNHQYDDQGELIVSAVFCYTINQLPRTHTHSVTAG